MAGPVSGRRRGLSRLSDRIGGALLKKMTPRVSMAPRGTGALTFSVPAAQPGDILAAVMGSQSNGNTFTVPAGWKEVSRSLNPGSCQVMVKQYAASDAGSITFAKNAVTDSCSGVMIVLSDAAIAMIGDPRGPSYVPFDLETSDVLGVIVGATAEFSGGEVLISSAGTPNVFVRLFRDVAGSVDSADGTALSTSASGGRLAIRVRNRR